MKKLIHRPVDDDQKIFFENEEQFSDWVSCQKRGTLFAADDHNNVYTVMCMDGWKYQVPPPARPRFGAGVSDDSGVNYPWAICYPKGFRTLTYKVLVRDFELSWIDNDQMLHLIDICEN